MHAYLLLDRSGSMQPLWEESLTSINAYVEELAAKSGPSDAVTLATFDAHETLHFDVLRRSVHPLSWKGLSAQEASPRGTTPLFDALARLMTLAQEDAPDRAVIVIITDGQENASREITRTGARALIEGAEKRGWKVVFLGANFADFTDAEGVGVAASRRMAFAGGKGRVVMQSLAMKSRNYDLANFDIDFNEADRVAAGEQDVKS
jgi:uncharacterized protein YegL